MPPTLPAQAGSEVGQGEAGGGGGPVLLEPQDTGCSWTCLCAHTSRASCCEVLSAPPPAVTGGSGGALRTRPSVPGEAPPSTFGHMDLGPLGAPPLPARPAECGVREALHPPSTQ
ncbi:pyridoxal kinase [Platysternon megacephalum]|uniref:Pyridoxal kinase n=1 Tax=Platysternon megacephalum TaxID=55544 RepID=A0A4D9E674_9SAUR|nr:pyridoxal kinase [Platysternon megacephalum]